MKYINTTKSTVAGRPKIKTEFEEMDFSKAMEKLRERSKQIEFEGEKPKCSHCNDTGAILVKRSDGIEAVSRCKCRDEKAKVLQAYWESDLADEHAEKTIADFDLSLYGSQSVQMHNALELCQKYIQHFKKAKEKKLGFYFWSEKAGSGKTLLACTIAGSIAKRYHLSSQALSAIELTRLIKSTYNSHTPLEAITNPLKAVQVLVIDDLGAEKLSETNEETFTDIIDARMKRKMVTIYTSNFKPSDLGFHDRLVSRIAASSVVGKFPDKDIRQRKGQEQELEFKNF